MPDFAQWVQLLANIGFPIVFTGGVLWLAWRYIPPWFERNLANQDKLVESAATTARAMQMASDTLTEHLETARDIKADAERLKAAMNHGSNALMALASAPSVNAREATQPHVDAMKEVIRR